MNIRHLRILPPILFVAFASHSVAGAPAQQVWDGAPFSVRSEDIAAGVRLIPDAREPGVVVLLDESRMDLDSSNRIKETHHVLYRIGTQSPGDWGAVNAIWRPWRQQKPAIRARVITADGREVRLDEKSVSESPLASLGLDTFGDGRILRAPLPALAPGAVVEIETVVQDTTSWFTRGIAFTETIGGSATTMRTSITVEAPQSMTLKFEVFSVPGATTTNEVIAGKRTIHIDAGRMDALDEEAMFPPSGENRQPRVVFSTASSWRDVADGYAQASNGVISSASPATVSAMAKDAIGGASNRDQIIDRILQNVERTIRYSAVQLGEAAIVPTSPVETVRLQYGDCKDQAALLVAMLRASGIDAYLALLRAGPGPDVDPSLPGFGLFDHAIVFIPGPAPLWLDSTTRFSKAGQLPLADQDRLALIVKPDTTELVRTPEYVARIVESQDVVLAEDGPAKVAFSREFHGQEEISIRSVQNEVALSDFQKAIEKAGGDSTEQSIRIVSRTEPADFSTPFKLQLEITGSRNALTSGNQAAVFISSEELLGETGFSNFVDVDDKLTADGVKLPERVARQWSYRIVPPPGYVIGNIPASKKTAMGPAIFTREFTSANDGVVTATILFDSGKRNFTATEFADLKKGLKRVLDDSDSTLTVSFDLAAQKELEAGKVAEALKEFRRLIELHPNEAIHHSQIARALLDLGLGDLARQEARRGVELEPKSAAAYDALGDILQYDLIGRRWETGFELEQAREAYVKALELDPDEDSYRADLAILLEVNAQGARFAPGLDLNPAIEQYRKLKQKPGDSSSIYRNLSYDLFRVGKFDELRSSSTPADIRIAAIAAADGLAAATREAGKLSGEARSKALNDAASMVILHRLYSVSAGLLKAAGSSASATPGAINASDVEKLHRYDDDPMPANDPKSAAKRVIVQIALRDRGPNLSALLTQSGQDELRRHPDVSFGGLSINSQLVNAATPPAFNADVYLSAATFSQEGDDNGGYRVEFSVGSYFKHIYVVRENGQYRVLSVGPADLALAREALRLVEKGDLENARQWIEWLGVELHQRTPEDSFGTLAADSFDEVWSKSLVKDRNRMRYAVATALAISPDDAARAIPILQEGMTKVTGNAQAGLAAAHTAALLVLKRYDESAAAGLKLLQSSSSYFVVPVLAQSMLELDRVDDLLKILKDNRKSGNPLNIPGMIAAIHVQKGNYADAESELKAIPTLQGLVEDQILWLSLFHNSVTAEDLAKGQKMVDSSRNADRFRTFAALKAETGDPVEALTLLKQGLRYSKDGMGPVDWYIAGRIYEQYGERQAALDAYRKVIPPARFPVSVISAYPLVQKRLAAK